MLQIEDQFEFDDSVFIAPSAILLGSVRLGKNTSIWFQSLLRGDVDKIVIGQDCNIQDGSILHVMEGYPVEIGDRVSFGHCVMAHGCKIGNDVLVGIRATILNGVEIGENCLVAAGALVMENQVIPPNSLVMGNPAKVVKTLTEKHHQLIQSTAAHYVAYGREYKKRFSHWQPLA